MYNQRDMEPFVTFCPQTNRMLDRGVEGEIRTARYLYENLKTRFVGNYRILANYNFPRHGANSLEIDLLAITSYGVFLLEVKNWMGIIEAYDDTWLSNGEKRENIFGSVNFKTKNIHSHVRDMRGLPFDAERISVIPLIVLVRGTQTFKNLSTFDSRGVVGLDQQLLHALSSAELLYRRERSQRLSDKDISMICDVLYRRHKAENEIVVEHYRLLKPMRKSDLFEEFEAQSTHVNAQRARLKCYHLRNISNQRVNEHTIEQFKRSIEVVSSLGYHPNIVQTVDFFPDPKYYDLYYEATELIDGKRLDEVMELWHQKDHSCSLKEQIAILESLCRALQHAHNHRDSDGNPDPVYHRNISFETVFFGRDSRTNKTVIKLADFDFAKFGMHTINPMYWGDPEHRNRALIAKVFTAPEVLNDASDATAASDIYALGVLWYFLARLPDYDPAASFDPEADVDQIEALQLPKEALAILKHMVAYNAERRPQQVEKVSEVLKLLKAKE